MTRSRLFPILSILLFLLSANTTASGQSGGSDPSMIKNSSHNIQRTKTLIAFQSKYGSTKQYAEWIQKESNGDLVNIENGDHLDLAGYDLIIIGGSVRVGKIVIAPFIEDHWSAMKEKKVILFTTSATPPRHPKIQSIYEKSLPEEIRKAIKYFPLHGRTAFTDFRISSPCVRIVVTYDPGERRMKAPPRGAPVFGATLHSFAGRQGA